MRYCNQLKSGNQMDMYKDERVRQEIENAIEYGCITGIPCKKSKRFRSAFTTEQVSYLEREFRKYPYIGNSRRKDIANVLHIPERAVKIWFQNRRMKEKKDKETNKESDNTPSVEVNEGKELRNMKRGSSPVLNVSASPTSFEVKVNIPNESIHTNKCSINVTSTTEDAFAKYKKENPTVINSNPVSTSPRGDITVGSLNKYKIVKNDVTGDPFGNNNGTMSMPLQCDTQHIDYFIPSPTAVLQDLSLKPSTSLLKTESHQKDSDIILSRKTMPFYLNYAQPYSYLPPGYVIWNPVSMAPIMTSAPIPAVNVPSPGCTASIMKRNCVCDCHTPCVAPMILQNNLNSNVQYVISAVSLQNSSPKF